MADPQAPSPATESQEENKPSPVEGIKEQSVYLRGTIAEELVDGNDFFSSDSTQLLKHHGTYQQDDRDRRAEARALGRDKAYMMMVRSKIPGGKLTHQQLLAELDLCDEIGNKTLRVTSRQGLQLHRVLKNDLQEAIQRINAIGLSTLGACGDVNRNVCCCPAPYKDPVHQQMQALADTIAEYFAPRSTAYHEIWLRGEGEEEAFRVETGESPETIEPIYGRHYLPRKFKIGIALPEDNCIDVYTHDLGLLTIAEGDTIRGYNVLVGGGLGVTPSAKKTFPALGKKLCFATPEQVLDVAAAVIKVQRDFGNRSDRKVARLKYLISNWGIERFKAKVEEYYGGPLAPPTDHDVVQMQDHMGWFEQGDGRWCYGLNIENGRIADTELCRMKSALREVCHTLKPIVRLTAHQSILFGDIQESDRETLEAILKKHHVPLFEQVSNTRRWSMACVAWPTCGLSITEAERALPGMVDDLEKELEKLGLSDEQFTMRMTGCPNGCARPYNPDIGLVGRAKGKYTLFLGGRMLGDRLNFLYKDMVPEEDVVTELKNVFRYFKQDRTPGEGFGDFCHRKGAEDLAAWVAQQS
jgi:sulfite reductase (ferredoxin)